MDEAAPMNKKELTKKDVEDIRSILKTVNQDMDDFNPSPKEMFYRYIALKLGDWCLLQHKLQGFRVEQPCMAAAAVFRIKFSYLPGQVPTRTRIG